MQLACIFLASGLGKRFFDNKLMADFGGNSLIEKVWEHVPADLFATMITVTRYEEIAKKAQERGHQVVWNESDNPALAVTIRLGMEAVPKETKGCFFMVCDQPFVTPDSVRTICKKFRENPNQIVALGYNGRRGNPVLFPKNLFGELKMLTDGESGSHVMKRHLELVTLAEAKSKIELTDIDTKEDWRRQMGKEYTRALTERIKAASGEAEPDFVIKNAKVVNVFANQVETCDIAISDGMIVGIGEYTGKEEMDVTGKYVCPGLIDGHVHIESSMLSVAEFAKAILPHGVTTVVTDPHEITNVLGTEGIDYMLKESENLPMDVFLMLPSCVPAGAMDESGARLEAKELQPYYENPRILGLAEMMAYFQAASGEEGVVDKIADAKRAGKKIDGHAPFLSGKQLNAYCTAGVMSDHECTNLEEALEKLKRGLWIMIREGTAAPNFDALRGLCEEPYYQRCMFVTDDRHPDDLKRQGSIDYIVRKAINSGADAIHAIRMGSLHAAQYFGLTDRGAVAPGYRADLLICSDLTDFRIEKVIKDGKLIVTDGRVFVENKKPEKTRPSFCLQPITSDLFQLKTEEGKTTTRRVIQLIPNQIITKELLVPFCCFSDEEDILKIAVLERHKNTGHVGIGFIKGYGLKAGAVATSVSHDSHNLIVVGTNDSDMSLAAETVRKSGGGIAFAVEDRIEAMLELPIAGLMSEQPIDMVIEKLERLREELAKYGMGAGIDPFMTLAFAALSVIPDIRINTFGLLDVKTQKQIPAIF